jgi:hypothetical protein
VSTTRNRISRAPSAAGRNPATRRGQLDRHPALAGELQAVGDQVHQHLADALGVGQDPGGRGRVDLDRQPQALLGGGVAPGVAGRADQVVQVGGHVVQVDLAGLDLRQVQHVVEHLHQAVARLDHQAHVAALGFVEVGAVQGVGHAQQAVHRRAQLVAGDGHEGGLGAVGLQGPFALLAQAAGQGVHPLGGGAVGQHDVQRRQRPP